MKIQQSKPLSTIYNKEESFSLDVSENIYALEVGAFEDAETESKVGTRRADIVAKGVDGILVVENQFGKADWDHWGRLEAYARLKEASVAVLVAEDFEELMLVTCNLRNEDSKIDWYLIRASVNLHDELAFHHIARPSIDIQIESTGVEYSEFWEPVRKGGLFSGKPVPVQNEGWVGKRVNGIDILLVLCNHHCSVALYFNGEDRMERRAQVLELFSESEYTYDLGESLKSAKIVFPVLQKGKNDHDSWDEIRTALTTRGEEIYNKIKDADV